MDHFAEVVQRLLHRPFATCQPPRAEAERPVAVADSLAHEVGTTAKGALVAEEQEKEQAHQEAHPKEAHPNPSTREGRLGAAIKYNVIILFN